MADLGKQRFHQLLQADGEIEAAIRERIDAATDIEAASEIGRTMGGDVSREATQAWNAVTAQTQIHVERLLEPFLTTIGELNAPLRELAAEPVDVLHHDSVFDRIKVGLLEQTIFSSVAFSVVAVAFAPLALTAAAAAALWGFLRGIGRVGQQQLDKAKQELRKHLSKVMGQTRQHFFRVDYASLRKGPAEEFFAELIETATLQVRDIRAQRTAELDAEIVRLETQAKADARQRAARIAILRDQLAACDNLGQPLCELADELNALESSLTDAA